MLKSQIKNSFELDHLLLLHFRRELVLDHLDRLWKWLCWFIFINIELSAHVITILWKLALRLKYWHPGHHLLPPHRYDAAVRLSIKELSDNTIT